MTKMNYVLVGSRHSFANFQAPTNAVDFFHFVKLLSQTGSMLSLIGKTLHFKLTTPF